MRKNWRLLIAVVYCPPKHTIKKKFVKFFNTLENRFLASRDYNSKDTYWGSTLITPKTKQLYMAMERYNLKTSVYTCEPSYWHTDMNKLPDNRFVF